MKFFSSKEIEKKLDQIFVETDSTYLSTGYVTARLCEHFDCKSQRKIDKLIKAAIKIVDRSKDYKVVELEPGEIIEKIRVKERVYE
jgi:hypothetical protein